MSDNHDLEKRLDFLRIDAEAKKNMDDFYSSVKGDVPDIINEFYQHLSRFDETQGIINSHSDVATLTEAQSGHWENMFSGNFDESYVKQALKVGRVHEVIGLEPRWYLGGYFLLMEKMMKAFLKKNGLKSQKTLDQMGSMLRMVCLDIDLALMTYIESGQVRKLREQLLELTDDVLTEADQNIQSVSDQTRLMRENVVDLNDAQVELQKQVEIADQSLNSTIQAIQTVAAATEELTASSESIHNQVQTSESIAQEAMEQSHRSQETVRSLEETAQEISAVVALVQNIASQTRLLALNATIEAARAGEAGKGFAVVASEVKNLAAETEKAIDQVNASSQEIQQATERAAREIETTNQLIQSMGENIATIAESVDQQNSATGEISSSAASASDSTENVNLSMQEVGARNFSTQSVARKVANISDNVMRDVAGVSTAMEMLLRTSYAGNRRDTERVPIGMATEITQNGVKVALSCADLGLGGVSLRLHEEGDNRLKTGACQIMLSGLGAYEGEIKNISGLIVNVAFGRHSDEGKEAIIKLIAKTKEQDQVYIDLVQEGAKRAAAGFEDAIQKNKIAFEDFFDIDYQPIVETNPRQLMTKFTHITDEYLVDIQEELVTRADNIVFAACVDRQAYLPTHNLNYSKEQSDDPVWNDANCRNRRIFSDPAGLRAARNTQKILVQAYDRQVGDQRVLLKEVDAPIHIRGRHWGNMRLAYRL